ncbi:cytochrome P450 [Paraphoma chrysanthemicola]|uniref:Cytochrome P450 n=1 Tax=Paraphoma chrysanthemicola TaxID=798071 RepID=A0A8K0QX96_9PLEO|nr:cytochrome P450 [Paraphoma chrysanthemicola]
MGILKNTESYPVDFSATNLGIILAFLAILYPVLFTLYNVYLHPLSKYPGPRFAAATRLWYCYYACKGTLGQAIHEAHKKYGHAIRIAPNELSFTDPAAWEDIYGHRVGKPELMKDPTFYASLSSGPESIMNAEHSRHRLLRKQIANGFSDRSLKEQEPAINGYVDMLMNRLEGCVKTGESTVDLCDWFNFFTFDVTGEMVFGQSYGCLSNQDYHPWVKLIFDAVKVGAFVRSIKYYPILAPLAQRLVPKELGRRRMEQRELAKEKVEYRRSLGHERQDLLSGYLKPESGITPMEFKSTAEVFIIGGSETTATLMSGLTYYLLRDPSRLAKLQAEVRNAFTKKEDITFVNVSQLPYLLACLDEALRIYPPFPDAWPRNTGPRSEIIGGRVVPPNTVLSVHQWSTHHSPLNFKNPDDFIPERWLEGTKGYESDRKDAVQAFHVGPRNCIGKSLAYFEMRLTMARLLWQFDLELDPRSEQWKQQRTFLLWEKPPLLVKLKQRTAQA